MNLAIKSSHKASNYFYKWKKNTTEVLNPFISIPDIKRALPAKYSFSWLQRGWWLLFTTQGNFKMKPSTEHVRGAATRNLPCSCSADDGLSQVQHPLVIKRTSPPHFTLWNSLLRGPARSGTSSNLIQPRNAKFTYWFFNNPLKIMLDGQITNWMCAVSFPRFPK